MSQGKVYAKKDRRAFVMLDDDQKVGGARPLTQMAGGTEYEAPSYHKNPDKQKGHTRRHIR